MTFPEQPGNGDQPHVPEVPQIPEVPQVPEAPTAPQVPTAPEVPEAPQFQPQAPPVPPAPQYGQPQYQQPQQPQYQAPQQPQQQAPQYAPQQPQYQQQYAPVAYGEPGVGEPFNGAADVEDLTRPLYGATFGQAVRRFFKNYVNFKGRASRSEYWWVQLFITLIMLVPTALYIVGAVMLAAGSASSYSSSSYETTGSDAAMGTGIIILIISGILMLIIGLGTLLPSLGIAWRRLHDANFAGPFYFLAFTYIGSIVVLVFTIMPSKPEGRRFDVV